MKTAWLAIREQPHYRRDAFAAGLRACGYDVKFGDRPASFDRDTVFVSWNRYYGAHEVATRVEAAGGTVLVAENGYIGNDENGRQFYAVARSGHNGSGWVPEGGRERFDALGVELKPWRATGRHVLICANRSFGMPGMVQPADWVTNVRHRLQRLTRRELRVRLHPEVAIPKRSLAEDLVDAWCTVIWSSSAGVHSLVAGVPVIAESPFWVCKAAAGKLEKIEAPPMPDRLPSFSRLAFSQWSVDEIASGEPFRRLIEADSAVAMA